MIKEIDGQTWFCCPGCGKKLHPVKRGARGVLTRCRGKLPDGRKCDWSGEVLWNPDWGDVERGTISVNEYRMRINQKALSH